MNYWSTLDNLKKFNRGLCKVPRDFYNQFEVRSMLDLGCGMGDTYRLLDHDLRYVGLDYTMQFLRYAKNRMNEIDIVNGIAETLPFPSKSFEMVTCRALLEHVLNPDPILHEMVRVTTGLIVIVWFLEPQRGESLSHHDHGYWNNRHSRDRIMKAIPGYELIDRLEVDRHTVWTLTCSSL